MQRGQRSKLSPVSPDTFARAVEQESKGSGESTMNTKSQISALQKQIRHLRKLGRTKRKPVVGIGGLIQTEREKLGIGLRELAINSKVSAGLLSRIEQTKDSNPQWWTICKILTQLNISWIKIDTREFK